MRTYGTVTTAMEAYAKDMPTAGPVTSYRLEEEFETRVARNLQTIIKIGKPGMKVEQEARQRRRKLKEKMEILRTLKEFTDNNKQLKISLYKALNTMQKTEENQGQRMYTPRIRTDITLAERGGAGK
ncbi:hypothetical protein [Desulfitobacterium chlororespirans]|uniref:Uncharacterized protein n=1 Tax=Desulfitobacterium chlororespirans DSM 11544 TaxID=1121395 RepID=A0A1M7U3A8_9FIRM|nr:hypothetical protein [Desulfitobacterium chlororespirans]SHN77377.1 hypothetical protein SAMN02745215_02877 [Desulfitobacterium chlororespirans DSM 11544]